MNANVSFRHMDSSPALKDYAVGKLQRVVKKYVHGKVDADIVMSVEKFRHIANFTINIKNLTVKGESRSEDMYSSIDLALDKIERQLRRHKDRLRDHKPSSGKGKSFRMAIIPPIDGEASEYEEDFAEDYKNYPEPEQQEAAAPEPEEEAQETYETNDGKNIAITRQQDYEARALSVQEAVIQLDLMEERQFFVFTNVESDNINIIYKRADGNFGLIET